mgnify:CR=1 FL=1
MPRKPRFWHPNVFFHVVMRGNNRQYIFNDRSDINELFRVFSYVYDKHPFTIISYCIMSNHYHLLLRSSEVPLSKIMMLANKRYTQYYKKKYRFTGQLYEKRYYASPIFDAQGILETSRYIHRNPIETKVPMVERMEHYPYSSYRFYKLNEPPQYQFLNLTILPSLFKKTVHQTNDYLCAFTEMNNHCEINSRCPAREQFQTH